MIALRRLLATRTPWPLLIAACAAAFLLILAFGSPTRWEGLDPSWTEVLAWGFLHHAQWGRDLIFTYGPLGFLQPYASYVEGIFPWYAAGEIALPGAFALAIGLLLRRSTLAVFAAFVFAYACWSARLAGDVSWALTLLYGTTWLILRSPQRIGIVSALVIALLALAFAAIALAKFSLFPLWALCVALQAGAQLLAGTWRRALAVSATFAAALIALWIGCGQQPLNLVRFISASLEIASGYGHAMGEPAPFIYELLGLGLLGAFVLACGVAAWLKRGDRLALGVLALAAAASVLFWLAFITRGDHWPWFFPAMSLLPFMLLCSPQFDGLRWSRPILLAFALLPIAVEPLSASSALGQLALRMRNSLYNLNHLPELAATRQREWRTATSLGALPQTRARVGDASIDVLTWEQGIVIVNGFNYSPRPVFQSYSAYTPWLARLNEAHFLGGGAPKYVLLKPDFVDGRLPTSEDGLALIALLRRYRPVLREKGFLLLELHGYGSALPVGKVETTQRANLGEDVALPDADAASIAFVDARLSAFGKLYTLFFREPALNITLHTASGDEERYRLVRATAAIGFIVNPLVTSNNEVVKLYYGKPLRHVQRFTIDTGTWLGRYLFEPSFSVAFTPLGKLAPAPLDVAALLLYPGFNIQPSGESDFRTVIEEGEEAVFVHAPGMIPFQPPPGRYHFTAKYGVQRIAIDDPGCAHSNPDGIGVALALIHDGRETLLSHTLLDPFHSPRDAGPHYLDVDGIDVAAGDTVEYRVDNGPDGQNVACDWSYVRDVLFVPSKSAANQAKPKPYPGFNLEPLGGALRVIVDDGKPAVFLHAPDSIEFAPAPGHYRVAAEFGVQSVAVKDPGCVRAGADGIGAALVLHHAGKAKVLRRIELNPFLRRQDAGPHELIVEDLAVASGDRVVWRIDLGPGDNSSCDWSYVRDLTITKRDADAAAAKPDAPSKPRE